MQLILGVSERSIFELKSIRVHARCPSVRESRNWLKEVIMTSGLEWLLILWGIVTGIFLILLFYRSTLTRQEDDQLFLDETASSRATEQSQLLAKVNRITPLLKVVGATSGAMILVIAGWVVYIGLNSVQP
jgi:hypothetical protein